MIKKWKLGLFSKDDPVGYSERKMRRGRQKKRWRWEENIEERTRMDLIGSTRVNENNPSGKEAKASEVSQ